MLLQAEAAIDSWGDWCGEIRSRPRLLGPLAGGRSNHSYLLESAGSRMVLRINGPETVLPGQERSHEGRIWQSASDAGIAPPLLYVDTQHRFLVSTYIENRLPKSRQDDPVLAKRALELLRRCHRLEVAAPEIGYATHIEHYWKTIENGDMYVAPDLLAQREPMRDLLAHITNSDTSMGLCHHDPVVENFVGSPGRLYLIDWEYAVRGLQVIDYAALVIEWGLDDSAATKPTATTPELLSAAKDLYRYMCALWDVVKVNG